MFMESSMHSQYKTSGQNSLPPQTQAEKAHDDAVFAHCLAHVRAQACGDVEGIYGPQSTTWQIGRESVLLLGGLRALVLQLAHPAVAEGVNQSSTFRNDPMGRARRTFTSTYEVIFGDLNTAIRSGTRTHAIHHRVRGEYPATTTPRFAGQSYRANDPALLMWVWATLVATSLLTYETFLRPLTLTEKAQYYAESHLSAVVSGVPPTMLPPTLTDFYTYYQAMLEGPELLTSTTTGELAKALFKTPYLRFLQLDEIVAAGLLPPRFHAVCGLAWEAPQQQRFRQAVAVVRLIQRLTPASLRAVPAYHQARTRLAKAYGHRPPLTSRLISRWDLTKLMSTAQ